MEYGSISSLVLVLWLQKELKKKNLVIVCLTYIDIQFKSCGMLDILVVVFSVLLPGLPHFSERLLSTALNSTLTESLPYPSTQIFSS